MHGNAWKCIPAALFHRIQLSQGLIKPRICWNFFFFWWASRRCMNRWESVLEPKLTRGTFERKTVFSCVCVLFSPFFGPFQCDCHENEGFVSQRHSSRERLSWQPRDGGCCAVNKQFAWASAPFKGSFSFHSDHVKNVVVKGSPLFFAHKDVRWAELEFPNMLIHESVNAKPLPPRLITGLSFAQRYSDDTLS